jgi:hypothetical protein
MKKPITLFVVDAGRSKCGKDTVSGIILRKYYPSEIIKFARPFKKVFENWLGLLPYSLDKQDYKNTLVTNPLNGKEENFTYGELMVRAYKAWDDIYPGGALTTGYVYEQIVNKVLNGRSSVVLNDVRKQCEVDVIKQLKNDKVFHLIVRVNLLSDRGCVIPGVDDVVNFDDEEWLFDKEFTINNHKHNSIESLTNSVVNMLDCLQK